MSQQMQADRLQLHSLLDLIPSEDLRAVEKVLRAFAGTEDPVAPEHCSPLRTIPRHYPSMNRPVSPNTKRRVPMVSDSRLWFPTICSKNSALKMPTSDFAPSQLDLALSS
jgi:hypothetical protein